MPNGCVPRPPARPDLAARHGHQQLSILRHVLAERQDSEAEYPANQQVDDPDQHGASQPSPRQARWRWRRSPRNRVFERNTVDGARYELLITIIRGARVPQDLPGPAGVSAGAPEADPLRVRAAEVFADERILHRHARRHRTVHTGEWVGVARVGA